MKNLFILFELDLFKDLDYRLYSPEHPIVRACNAFNHYNEGVKLYNQFGDILIASLDDNFIPKQQKDGDSWFFSFDFKVISFKSKEDAMTLIERYNNYIALGML